MKISTKRLFLITNNFGAVLGTFPNNINHKHYTIQITISDKPFTTKTNTDKLTHNHCLIGSNIEHSIHCDANQVLLILNINPFSDLGLWCKNQLKNKKLMSIDEKLIDLIWMETRKYFENKVTSENLETIINNYLITNYSAYTSDIDQRIISCLRKLRKSETMLSAKQMAKQLNISESRFLHLFKSETGLTYRRMKLWFQLEKSFQNYNKFRTLTELAHFSGFSDSAHFSRTFKESFGMSPRDLFANSSFIQE